MQYSPFLLFFEILLSEHQSKALESMAIANSPTLPFSKLDYTFLSSRRTSKIVPPPLAFSNIYPRQITLSKKICEISGFKSRGFVSFSRLSDQIEEESLTGDEASFNNKASDLQVHTW